MRTKRGGYITTKPKQGTPRVKIKARAAVPKVPDAVRLAAISTRGRKRDDTWKSWGPDAPLEPLRAGLNRYLRFRAPRHLWAVP